MATVLARYPAPAPYPDSASFLPLNLALAPASASHSALFCGTGSFALETLSRQ